MDLQLKNKVVIVTGGTSGIGEAITRTFAQEGANVVFVGRNEAKGEKLEKEFSAIGVGALFVKADLTVEENCKHVITSTIARFGRIDVLVNNAGVNDKVGLEESPSAFMQSIYKNLFHFFAVTHYALPYLKATKGNIVNIGSKVANTGQGGTSGYAASKGGVQALTREWAASLLEYNIRVNEVIPAEVWTPLYEKQIMSTRNPEATLRMITSRIPLGKRMTTSEEIANMTVFLASNSVSAHTTGQLIYVDGGYTHLDRLLT